MYRAIWRVKHNHTIYEPGETITGLSADAAKELLQLKAIEIIPTASGAESSEEQEVDEMAAFKATLHAMKRPELLAYAKKVNVEVDLKMKNAEICDLLLKDAEENGVDIESLDDQALKVFATELGGNVSEEMNREQLIVAIDKKLEEGNHE